MSNELTRKRIAFLVAHSGVEQVELTSAGQAVHEAGGEPTLQTDLEAFDMQFVDTFAAA